MSVVVTAATGVAVLLLARLAGRAAAAVRQPRVVGEIVLGLVALPLLWSAVSSGPVPRDLLGGLRTVGDLGLILFVAAAAHELARARGEGRAGGLDRVALGVLLPSLLAGAAFAVVLLAAGEELRAAGRPRATALRVGVLVNTRGLTEIVVLDAALDAGLLTPTLFASLLVMTLVTTAATGPALDLLAASRRRRTCARTWPPPGGRRSSTTWRSCTPATSGATAGCVEPSAAEGGARRPQPVSELT